MKTSLKVVFFTALLSIAVAVPVLAAPVPPVSPNESDKNGETNSRIVKEQREMTEHVEDLMPASPINMEILKARDDHARIVLLEVLAREINNDARFEALMAASWDRYLKNLTEIYNNYTWLSGFNPEYKAMAEKAKADLDAAKAEYQATMEFEKVHEADLEKLIALNKAQEAEFNSYRELFYSGQLPIPTFPKHGFGYPDANRYSEKPAK